MKKYTILLLIILGFTNLNAQNYGGNFGGSDYTNFKKTSPVVIDSSCFYSGTRIYIISLRNSNLLDAGCSYIITDHVQGQLVTGTTITLHAVSTNEFSENVSVNTTYDNEGWRGIYDIDRALVLELQDNRNNIARGFNGTEVSNFDWGNASYTNVVVDNSTLTVNIGNTAPKSNVTVKNLSSLNLTNFTGSINNFTVDIVSIVNLTGANGTWRYSEIKDNSTLNASGYTGGGDNYYNTIYSTSNINISNTTTIFVLRNTDLQQGTIVNTGNSTGTFNMTGSKVQASSIIKATTATGNLSITNGQFLDNSSVNLQFGAMTLSNCKVEKNSNVTQNTINTALLSMTRTQIYDLSSITNSAVGNVTINDAIFNISTFNKSAGSTSTVTIGGGCTFSSSSSVNISATGTGNLNISGSHFYSASYTTQSSASNITLTRSNLWNNANVTAQAGSGGALQVTSSDLLSGSAAITKLASSTAGNLVVSGAVLESRSFIQTGGIGNLNVSQIHATGSSGINVTGGNRNYSLTRFNMSGVGRANFSGTNTAATDNMQDIGIYERGTLAISCSGATNSLLYSSITGLSGSLNLTGTTGGASLNRIKVQDGTLSVANSINTATLQLLTITNGSVVTFNTNPAGTALQYSSFFDGSAFTLNKTGIGSVSYLTLNTNSAMTVTGATTTISEVAVELGVLNISGGSLSNCSKKLNSTWTITGGAQTNTHHWSATNKTTAVANTNKIDYLGVVSTVPIL